MLSTASTASSSSLGLPVRAEGQGGDGGGDGGGDNPTSGPKPMLPYSSMFVFGPTNP